MSESPRLETDPRFPSGKWVGFWIQKHPPVGRQPTEPGAQDDRDLRSYLRPARDDFGRLADPIVQRRRRRHSLLRARSSACSSMMARA